MTLRVNGRACVSTRPEPLSQLTPWASPSANAVVLGIEEVYPHCPEVLLRSAAWNPELTIADIEQVEADSLDYRYE